MVLERTAGPRASVKRLEVRAMFQRVSAHRDAHPAGGSEATVGLPRRAFRLRCLDLLRLGSRITVERKREKSLGVPRGTSRSTARGYLYCDC